MSEVRVVDLKELGVNKEVFDKIYSMGEQDGRADAIDLIDRHLWNYSHEVWEDFRPILEQLKEHKNGGN